MQRRRKKKVCVLLAASCLQAAAAREVWTPLTTPERLITKMVGQVMTSSLGVTSVKWQHVTTGCVAAQYTWTLEPINNNSINKNSSSVSITWKRAKAKYWDKKLYILEKALLYCWYVDIFQCYSYIYFVDQFTLCLDKEGEQDIKKRNVTNIFWQQRDRNKRRHNYNFDRSIKHVEIPI